MATSRKEVQVLNDCSLMQVTELPMVNVATEVQAMKASFPMSLTESGIVKAFNDPQSLKA